MNKQHLEEEKEWLIIYFYRETFIDVKATFDRRNKTRCLQQGTGKHATPEHKFESASTVSDSN